VETVTMTAPETLPRALEQAPEVTSFFDNDTNTWSYVVADPATGRCAIIDSVMNFDQPSGSISFESADAIIAHIREQKLQVEWILETHVHADHLSAAPYLQEALGGKIGIGSKITVVQDTFGKVFNEGTEFQRDGSQFDWLFNDGDSFLIGELVGSAWHTPGHTPACVTFVIGDAAFVGDTLFMPDSGTARVDFPGGDAHTLYQSIQRILSLPDEPRLFLCHDYGGEGRDFECATTVAAERRENIHVRDEIDENDFISMRTARDKTLGMPQLILPSLQVNMRAGHLPPADADDRVFLKLPVNAFN
jgi:glyoxylase-like metal-dependent hydrolase (beta-lactamase superfamily II)